MGNACIPNIEPLIQVGINPATGLPYKASEDKCTLKNDIERVIRILDEQDAINRYKWYNLPNGLTSQLMERILYYKGQGIFFYMESTQTFLFLPYALSGSIDVYGNYKLVTPLPFNGTAKDSKDAWIVGLNKEPIYDIEDIPKNAFVDGCVIIRDFINGISQTNIPRWELQRPIIDAEAEAFPLARTNLISHSGIKGMRVNDEDQQSNVEATNKSVTRSALTGKIWVPMVGNIDFQELTDGSPLRSEEFLVYMQSLDNFRLSLLGLENGGIFEKKAHMLESEQMMTQNNVGRIINDGLSIRQHACDIINSIWGLGVFCELSETVSNFDSNLDGVISDEENQDGVGGEQPKGAVIDEQM